MDIEYYRNFIAIVEAGSISAAAKQIAIEIGRAHV